jgi:hypothetical protein
MKLTERQQQIWDAFLQLYQTTNEPVSPTALGLELGFDYNSASAKTTPTLKKFVALGWAKRTTKGRYIPMEPNQQLE